MARKRELARDDSPEHGGGSRDDRVSRCVVLWEAGVGASRPPKGNKRRR